jgi:hypothetical protein
MARGAFIALVRQLDIATAGANRQGLYLSRSCPILEQGVGLAMGATTERTCGAYVYDCFVTFVLTTSTDNVSYSKTVI